MGQLVVDVVGLVGDVVAQLVPRAVRSALGRAPVVGHHDHHRVVGVGSALDLVEHPPDVVVGVGQEPGEHLHHPGVEALTGRVDVGPCLDPLGARREHGVGRHDARRLLAGEGLLAPHVPPGVEAAGEAVDPLRRRLVRGMRRTGGVPEQVGAVRVVEAEVAELGDGLVGQVGVEVVALLRGRRRLDVVLVAHQVGRPLVGLAVEEAVVALETEPGRPGVERAVGPLVAWGEVPLADGRRRVAPVEEHLGEGAGGVGDLARVARIVDGHVGQHPHADAVVVAPREQRGARGRAHRGGVEVREAQTPLGQAIEVRGLEVRPVAAQLGEPEVVEHDDHDVRRADPVGLLGGRRPAVGQGQRDGRWRHRGRLRRRSRWSG